MLPILSRLPSNNSEDPFVIGISALIIVLPPDETPENPPWNMTTEMWLTEWSSHSPAAFSSWPPHILPCVTCPICVCSTLTWTRTLLYFYHSHSHATSHTRSLMYSRPCPIKWAKMIYSTWITRWCGLMCIVVYSSQILVHTSIYYSVFSQSALTQFIVPQFHANGALVIRNLSDYRT